MRLLTGQVSEGYGAASTNLAPVMGLIEGLTGLCGITPGTLNISIPDPHIVKAEWQINSEDYDGREALTFQRCRISGVRAIIMRPDSHKCGEAHGPAHLELMARVNLRQALGLKTGDSVEVEIEGDDAWWLADAS
jgi:CTP-dependent riboflavin kinase